MRNAIVSATLVLCVSGAGCTSFKAYPNSNLQYQIFPQVGAVSESEMQRLLEREVLLPSQITVGIAWMNQRGGDFDALPDAERGRLLATVADELEVAPIWRSVVLPTVPGGTSYDREEATELAALRTVGARFMSDVLVILNTSTNEYVDWNPLALSYLAILPIYFFPGDDLSVYASVEACAVDIRSGVFLGCAQGQSSRQRSFVTKIRRDLNMRALTTETLQTALADIPRALGPQIARHTGGLVYPPRRPTGAVPSGPRYRTMP